MDSNLNGNQAVPPPDLFPTLEDYNVDVNKIYLPFKWTTANTTQSNHTLSSSSPSTFSSSLHKHDSITHECFKYDHSTQNQFVLQNCTSEYSDNRYCFTIWHGEKNNLMMGCWPPPGNERQCPKCDLTAKSKTYFCCCAGNRCNLALSFPRVKKHFDDQQLIRANELLRHSSISASSFSSNGLNAYSGSHLHLLSTNYFTPFYFALTLLPLLLLTLLFVFAFRFVRKRKLSYSNARSIDKKSANLDSIESQQPFLTGVQIKQLEIISSSRNATVWKGVLINENAAFGDDDESHINSLSRATLPAHSTFPAQIVAHNNCSDLADKLESGTFRSPFVSKDIKSTSDLNCYVAIKVMNFQKTWKNEREVYMINQIRHKNILKFITAEERPAGKSLQTNEYWLVTEYHENGSLHEHLKQNTLSYYQMLKISLDIAQGLALLHSHVDGSNNPKPIIAHRDLKSQNILLKSDLTACIADFGMSLIMQPNQPAATSLGQVGTLKYMAPEYLDGAIHFSGDALLRIDIYACAMIFWEMLTRCTAHGQPIEPFLSPFEKELGKLIDLETLRKYVSEDRNRPEFPSNCYRHHGLAMFCKTIEDCWDQDAEARLSASCVEERLLSLLQTEKSATECLSNKLTGIALNDAY